MSEDATAVEGVNREKGEEFDTEEEGGPERARRVARRRCVWNSISS
jgi:hypothetical protein